MTPNGATFLSSALPCSALGEHFVRRVGTLMSVLLREVTQRFLFFRACVSGISFLNKIVCIASLTGIAHNCMPCLFLFIASEMV